MSRETDIEADASRVELVPRVVTGLPSSDSEASIALIEACGLPEIGWRLTDFGVRLVEDLPVPFRLDERTISIRTNEVRDVVSAAMILREAIELSSLPYRTRPGASRVSALVTAAIYAGTVLLPRTQSLRAEAPLTLRVEDVLESPRGVIDTVLSVIRGRGEHLEPLDEENLRAAIAALPLSIPTEVLLTLGGDHRQTVDWERGVNSYGVSPRPTPWQSAFGSCTASSPTPRGFAAAHDLRHRLLVAALHGRLLETAEAASDEIRDNILRSLGIDPSEHTGVDVVLTPSGTDAELVVLTVSMAVTSQLTSIVVAPEEIGSGSLPAANGRHFSTTLPTGGVAEPGRAFDESVDGRVSVIEIPVRDTDGELLAVEDVEDLIEKALAVAPDRVLLHVVEGSKTGIRAPRSETVAAWQARFGDRMDVVVDAAQMRVDQTTVVDHLAQGRMVIITGSKFFGGPPFSGAVLIPERLRARITSSDAVLRGLGAYLSRTDVPGHLSTLRTVAHETPNYALLCRWAAALAEMRSFHNASPEIRDEVLRKLAAGIREALDESSVVEIVESPYSRVPKPDHRGLDELPTIFTFLVRKPDGEFMTYTETREVYSLLGRDLSGKLGPSEPAVLHRAFQLGQPVKVKYEGDQVFGALRIAIGAPTISRVLFDPTRGSTWMDRLNAELGDVRAAVEKLSLIARHGPAAWPV